MWGKPDDLVFEFDHETDALVIEPWLVEKEAVCSSCGTRFQEGEPYCLTMEGMDEDGTVLSLMVCVGCDVQ